MKPLSAASLATNLEDAFGVLVLKQGRGQSVDCLYVHIFMYYYFFSQSKEVPNSTNEKGKKNKTTHTKGLVFVVVFSQLSANTPK